VADEWRGASHPAAGPDWDALERSPEFKDLVTKRRSFLLPVIVLLGAWYLLFLVLCAWAPDFMGGTFISPFTVGHFWGVSIILLVWVIAFMYLRFSHNELDPRAEAVLRRAVAMRDEEVVR
jgi:uncharacterized membrane protein (DUF485 family)